MRWSYTAYNFYSKVIYNWIEKIMWISFYICEYHICILSSSLLTGEKMWTLGNNSLTVKSDHTWHYAINFSSDQKKKSPKSTIFKIIISENNLTSFITYNYIFKHRQHFNLHKAIAPKIVSWIFNNFPYTNSNKRWPGS